jgi:hypothetical protein
MFSSEQSLATCEETGDDGGIVADAVPIYQCRRHLREWTPIRAVGKSPLQNAELMRGGHTYGEVIPKGRMVRLADLFDKPRTKQALR